MTPSRSTSAVLLALLMLPACASEIDQVGSHEAALSAQDWSAPIALDHGSSTVSLAFLGGKAYAALGPWNITLLTRQASGWWSSSQPVPGLSAGELRLAPFNGKLYLLNQPFNSTTLVLSRFDPATMTWSQPSQLPFQSNGLPGFAAQGNQLYLLGTQPDSTHGLWLAAMDTQGTFQPAQSTSLAGIDVSLASHGGRLHAFFRSVAAGADSGAVLHSALDSAGWTAPATISMGFGGSVLRGKPMAASYVGDGYDCLHLTAVDENWNTNIGTVWWTSACGGADFAVPVTLATVNAASVSHSLAASTSELMLAYPTYDYQLNQVDILRREYHYPRADGQPCTQASDCASAVCTTSFADLDGDGFGSTASSVTQCGPLPAGRSLTPRDCCDLDARVKPGQSQYFSTPGGCDGYDYDCSGAALPLYPPRATSGCTSLGSCTLRNRSCSGPYWTTANTAPACGVAASWRTCFLESACKGGTGSECGAMVSYSQTQACR